MGGICSQTSKQAQSQNDLDSLQTLTNENRTDAALMISQPEEMPGMITKKQKPKAVHAERPPSSRKYSDFLQKSSSQISQSQKDNQSSQPNIIDNLIIDIQEGLSNPHEFIEEIGSNNNKLQPADCIFSQGSNEEEEVNSNHIEDDQQETQLFQLDMGHFINNNDEDFANNQIETTATLQVNSLEPQNEEQQLIADAKNKLNSSLLVDTIVIEQDLQVNNPVEIVQTALQEDDISDQIEDQLPVIQLETIESRRLDGSEALNNDISNNLQQVDDQLIIASIEVDIQEVQDNLTVQTETHSSIQNQVEDVQVQQDNEEQQQLLYDDTPNDVHNQILKEKLKIEDVFENNKAKYEQNECLFNQQLSCQLLEEEEKLKQIQKEEELNQLRIQEEQQKLREQEEAEQQLYNLQIYNEFTLEFEAKLIELILREEILEMGKLCLIEEEKKLQLQQQQDEEMRLNKLKLEEEAKIQQELLEKENLLKIQPQIILTPPSDNQNIPTNFPQPIQVDLEEKDNDDFFNQLDEEDKQDSSMGQAMKVSLLDLDEESRQMKEDEEQLRQAETKLENYESKWAVKTVELSLGIKPNPSQKSGSTNQNGMGLLDGQSSTYEETNYDQMSEYSEYPNSARDNQQSNLSSPPNVILRKKTTRKRFPMKKKKVLSRAGSILDEQQI
eukprot:403331755